MQDLLKIASQASIAGGALLRGYFGQELPFREKAGSDIVTEADLASEATIRAILQTACPAFNIFSEEQGLTDKGSEYTWFVDPLDGTHNFVTGIPQFGVSIALVHYHKTVLGVVYQPMTDTLWSAMDGNGAQRNAMPFSVRQSEDIQRATIAYIQGYAAKKASAKVIQNALSDHAKRVVANWAPSLDWCLLAEGRIAGLVSLDSEREDQLAGTCIAREAGVLVTDFTGTAYDPGMTRFLATTHPALQAAMIKVLATIDLDE
ncbi:inositol monophosphatase family protein [Dictyobacter aurantiacus]|uniref:Inositol-1-monophosphatase n=1 Tax=Dictyobacter aurantiacus TaxID=1936993 RepID=A0A401ZL72_9CHLR|nr:inositol monophosphatase [Dictyobacter aurantiacus]GCE07564.1 inositol-1-monophosphatase [Dictyobacter aurantiacus]